MKTYILTNKNGHKAEVRALNVNELWEKIKYSGFVKCEIVGLTRERYKNICLPKLKK